MATPGYQVFVIVRSVTEAPSPVELLFSGGGAFFPPVRLAEDKMELSVDTRIAKCGRHGCTECSGTHISRPVTNDYEAFRRAGEAWDEASGVVIVKSSTIASALTATNVADVLSVASAAATAANTPNDIFYLAKWLDRPELFTTLAVLPAGGKIVRTWSPNGFQAVVFSPAGMRKVLDAFPAETNPVVCRPFSQVLSAMISAGTLVATTTTPSLMQFDSTRVVVTPGKSPEAAFSYLKTCECRGDTQPERLLTRRVSADLSLFWVVVVMLTAVFSVWALLKIGAIYASDGL